LTSFEDYPANLVEFEERFATEEACREYLVRLRWPDGFRCPRCQGDRSWPTGRSGLTECASCHCQTSVTAGTIFDGTRKPLRLWFRAMWFMTSQKNGVSALALQRQLGLKRYDTVWTWLHKLRRAMVRPGRDRLSGTVEVDETYVGGEEEDVHGRETETKSIVVIAAEENGQGIGRIRLRRVRDVSGDSLIPFVQESVQPGSVVHTDGWAGYGDLEAKGYSHKVTNLKRSGKLAHELMPRVHRVSSLLKRWILGTHQGAIGSSHLDVDRGQKVSRFRGRLRTTFQARRPEICN
jgi:transposase-like protein